MTDADDDIDSLTFSITVVDVTAPVITLNGDAAVFIVPSGVYTDAGATATDNNDGDITNSITTTITESSGAEITAVDTRTVGVYTLTYNVMDAAGNAADTVTRAVTVTPDVTLPVIVLNGDAAVTIELNGTYNDAGATATDTFDGDITSSITTTITNSSDATITAVDTRTVGVYTLIYNVIDAAGNTATAVIRAVTVTPDITAPVITLNGDAAVFVVLGESYDDAGATATDTFDGNISSNSITTTITNSSGVEITAVDTNVTDTYTLTYEVSDAASNTAIAVIRTVTVTDDVTIPIITLNGDTAVFVVLGESYDDAGAGATDNIDGDITVNIVVTGTVDTRTVGVYALTYNVSDAVGNNAIAVTRTVTVITEASSKFITVWNTYDENETIIFPGVGSYTIDWGDGGASELANGSISRTYAAADEHTITVSNTITRFNLNQGASSNRLMDVSQWGTARWTSMEKAFSGARNMRMSATDKPNLSGVTSMARMFAYATAFNQDIGGWNVAAVTDMSFMFFGATTFNQNIGGWNVAAVTNMGSMFYEADAFNQNLGRWYIVPSDTGDYDGGANLAVLTLNVQNTTLRRHNPVYNLVAGNGDADNALFTLTGSTLSVFDSAATGSGTYNVRIAASGGSTFGMNNAGTLTVTVPASSVATLSNLTLSQGTLTPPFDSSASAYTARVADSINSLTVTATTTSNRSVTVNGGAVTRGEASADITLTVDDNAITLEVTAENGTTRSYTLTVTRVPDTAPSFGTKTVDVQTYILGSAVSLTLPVASGGNGSLGYALSGNLPAGLTFNTNTYTIVGTPSAVATTATYTLTVTDADDDTDSLTFSITVNDAPVTDTDTAPSFGTKTVDVQTYTVGTAIPDLPLSFATGGNGSRTYTLSPDLPKGLTFNTSTYTISGTPSATATTTAYTLTVADTDSNTTTTDTATLTFSITVNADTATSPVADDTAPSFGTATITAQTYIVGKSVSLPLPVATGGNGSRTYTLSPDLPKGLTFNTSTYTISGTPSATATTTAYTLTVADTDSNTTTTDTATLTFSITVNADTATFPVADDTAPSFGTATITAQTYIVGKSVSLPLSLATGGNGSLIYSLSPNLPKGLTFNTTTYTIRGTPSATATTTAYTLTVADTDSNTTTTDTATLMFDITVNPATPVIPSFTLDVDDSGVFDINDALMIARYALSIKGANLTASLTSATPTFVVTNIEAGESSSALDVDEKGGFDINDALMIVRYALSIKGANLTASLTDATPTVVVTNIERLIPPK